MPDYFVGTQVEVQNYIDKLDFLMGYPNPATKTVTYGLPREHEAKPGTYYVIIKDVHSPLLGRQFLASEIDLAGSANEKTRTTKDTLDSEGAFKTTI